MTPSTPISTVSLLRGRAMGNAQGIAGGASIPWQLYPLAAYLAAIIIVGKGPTYLGYPPLFWGELVLLLGAWWLLRAQGVRVWSMQPSALSTVVLLFMLVGAQMTAVHLPRWGLNSVRDAALWYYAVFYFIGNAIGAREALANRFARLLLLFWALALCWGVADAATSGALSRLGPMIPWRGVEVTSNSHSETQQNMALGGLAVLITVAYHYRPKLWAVLCPIAIAGLVVAVASTARAPKVALGATLGAVLLLLTARGGGLPIARRAVLLGLLGLLCVPLVLAVADIDLAKVAQFDRFLQADPDKPSGTAYWRKVWWTRLHEQVISRNPLFGLGFGENLSSYNPLIVELDEQWPVRSPHNFNITVYARMGLVGAALWAFVLVLGLGVLFARVWRGGGPNGGYRPGRREELVFWLMVLIATWINSSFGVLMEGPVLGVLFWFVLGFAMRRSVGRNRLPAARLPSATRLRRSA